MRILVLLAIAGAACAAPSFVAPAEEPSPLLHVPAAAFAPATYISRHHAQDELGRVNYGFSHPGQAKNEVRDAFGNVAGAYSYIDADRKPVHVQYTAGFDGFQVRSNSLPVGPGALDVPEPVRDTPEVSSAKEEFVAAYESAAASAPDDGVMSRPAAVHSSDRAVLEAADEVVLEAADEVVLERAADAADAVFADDEGDGETATELGVTANTFVGGDEGPALEAEEDTPALVEMEQAYKPKDDELVPPADRPESVSSVETAEAKEESVPGTIETRFTVEGVPDGAADAAPSEDDGVPSQRISIEPLELRPNLAAINDNAHFRTIEVSELFPTALTKAHVQAIPADAEDTPVFNLDGSVTRYFGYLPPTDGSVSPLYTNSLPYGAYGLHVPMLIPYTVPDHAKQSSYIAAQTPTPYYFVPRNYVYRIPYASQFLNYIPLKDC